MAFGWRAYDGSALTASLVVLRFSGDPDKCYKETLYFYDFSGGGGPNPLSLLLDPPMLNKDEGSDKMFCCMAVSLRAF